MDFFSGVSTFAAMFSALSAFFAWRVADRALKFNKSLILNRSELEALDLLLESLIKLKSVRQINPLEMPDDDYLNTDKIIENIKVQFDSLSSSNKEVETTLKDWQNRSEGKIFVIINTKIPWKEIKESEPDFLDDVIDYFKTLKKNLLK
ncbi:hypothetical protein MTsDn1_19480 [Alteromonas sp. MTD1]|uniref:hypothetical protein n=1 Tax=Alteromonas sp. MTD1 TaxID=3057962 RepID=UPI0036F3E86E